MAKNLLSPISPTATLEKEKTTPIETKVPASTDQLYLLSALVQKEEVMDLLKKIVSSKAEIVKDESLGKKTLAYPINKHKELILVSIFFTAEPDKVNAIDKELHVEEEIERYLMTTWDDELPKEDAHTFRNMSRRKDS